MLEIKVDDYGPLIAGKVELKPLTIFVGPSNSGKSYMATVVYSLMNAIREAPASPFITLTPQFNSRMKPRVGGWSLEPLSLDANGLPAPSVSDALETWAAGINPNSDIKLSNSPTFLREVVDSAMEVAIDGIGESLSYELIRNYGGLSDLVRSPANDPHFQVRLQSTEPLLSIGLSLGSSGSELEVGRREFDASNCVMDGQYINWLWGNRAQFDSRIRGNRGQYGLLNDIIRHAAESAFLQVFGSLPLHSYYLPAARSGITQAQKAIAGTLVRHTQYAGLYPVEIPTLPGVVRDFISHMLTLQPSLRDNWYSHEAPTSALEPVVAFLESNVVKGIVAIEEVGGGPYPEIYYAPNGGSTRFPFHRTSSMVSELAPLILLLKHNVREGNLIILEEPESHLHPASQRQMARAVVRLVNAGVRVLLTTHSDLFLGALNNLLGLNAVEANQLRQLGLDDEDRLDPADVAAYQFSFDDQQRGSQIRRLEIRSDTGIDEDEFSSVVEELYDESITLQRMRGE